MLSLSFFGSFLAQFSVCSVPSDPGDSVAAFPLPPNCGGTWMRGCRIELFRNISNWLHEKAEKNRVKIDKYAAWGLFVFVALWGLNHFGPGVGETLGLDVREYSKEELIAEIGAAALVNHVGLETSHSLRNSAAYIQNWLAVLKNDKRFIVSASGKADKAISLILGC